MNKLPVFLLLVILTSCTTHKKITYLQDLQEKEAFTPATPPEYRLQNRDILYIQFFSLNAEMNTLLNGNAQSQSTMYMGQSEGSAFISGYVVNDSGKVVIPLLGQVRVVGLSLGEATAAIQQAADKLLKDATVQVKLLSFKFTVLGEVARPGTYRNFNNQLTVLEAIGTAGDITSFGNRERVLVLRPGNNGTQTYRINLKTKDLLSSEAFFLLPNDIVYVESIDSKIVQLNIPTISLLITTLFSTISTTLLILNFSK
ncbi:MAG: polysaccharide biosynthesis/export family protein [Bacteroidales bacterium]